MSEVLLRIKRKHFHDPIQNILIDNPDSSSSKKLKAVFSLSHSTLSNNVSNNIPATSQVISPSKSSSSSAPSNNLRVKLKSKVASKNQLDIWELEQVKDDEVDIIERFDGFNVSETTELYPDLYDYYVKTDSTSAVNFDPTLFQNYAILEYEQDWDELLSDDEEDVFEDEEDSNDEGNWRNEYPDEDDYYSDSDPLDHEHYDEDEYEKDWDNEEDYY
ncbi:hypothetical protein HK098_005512 [Nowakowskiella sp. JEL0407]|nr:hypothetical protein HK098_005512 [Nowakowskiella sp. JEL0407]